jgi:hypothetical protein
MSRFPDPLKKHSGRMSLRDLLCADFLIETENERFIHGFGAFTRSARFALIP